MVREVPQTSEIVRSDRVRSCALRHVIPSADIVRAAQSSLDCLPDECDLSGAEPSASSDSMRLRLSSSLIELVRSVLEPLSEGRAVVAISVPTELTTQQAADVLGVSAAVSGQAAR